ncbi:MAG: DUF3581 domain-containing protein [Methylococcales bacterium]|nr:DUF3581 domain-containing protein [Methylococcales bacterium]
MFLNQFYSTHEGQVLITAEQASHFAKDIAKDFNPLHNPDAKRFCVPGDLLVSLVIARYGLSQKMQFTFSGMVGHEVYLNFPDTEDDYFEITDDHQKVYMKVHRSGNKIQDDTLLEGFIRDYVAFSGPNFPHILVPLMAEQNVMINTTRPLVIYESMVFEFESLNFLTPELTALKNTLAIEGKRGEARFHFQINSEGKTVGTGFKKILISGMREYNHEVIQSFTEKYLALKAIYEAK